EASQTFALLVDAEPQPAADGLATLPLGADFTQSADLEDVGVVPTLLESRMGKNELQLGIEAEQLLLLLHDKVVRALGIVAPGLIVVRGVGPAARLIDRKVAVVDLLRLGGHVYLLEET